MNNFLNKKIEYKQYVVDSQLRYFKPHATKIEKSFAEEISYSLNQNSKFINPKFFYDKKGSELFESICLLPEYYPTRTEISILKKLKHDLPSYLDENINLVELGSGASVKTRLILDIFTKLQPKTEYFPIDISEILTESSEQLLKDYDTLHITGIIDTYEGGLEFLKSYDDKKNLLEWGNVFVLPTFYKMEGQPISILEAMATTNLVVTTNHAGISDVFQDKINGYFVEKNNENSIQKILSYLAANKSELKKIAEYNKRFFLNNFTVDIFKKNLLEIIK